MKLCFQRHYTSSVSLACLLSLHIYAWKMDERVQKMLPSTQLFYTPHNACHLFVHLKSCYREKAFQQVGAENTSQMSEQGSSAARPRRRPSSLDKMHKCPQCPYYTVYMTNYKNHLRTHTGEKPYSCLYCIYRTTTKKTLVEHTRTHTGEKPYSCTLCAYGSSTKQGLNRHMLVHTGEKPFSCKLCPYRAKEKAALRSHELALHSQQ